MELAKSLPYECASICSFCSRMKRGRIYTAARREGYNVLAMGQHLDDLAERCVRPARDCSCIDVINAYMILGQASLSVVNRFLNACVDDCHDKISTCLVS